MRAPRTDRPSDRGDGLAREERAAWAALSALLVRLPAALSHEADRAGGLTYFSYTMLDALADAPDGRLELAVLADAVEGALSRVWYALRRLEDEGLVWRERSERDRRAVVVGCTREGLARRDTVRREIDDLVRRAVLADRPQRTLDELTRVSLSILDRLAAAQQAGTRGKRYGSAR